MDFKLHLFFKQYLKKHLPLILIYLIFTTIYCSISFVNNYFFRTYALDLGTFNNAMYNFAHFNNAKFTLGIDGIEIPFLATHFSLLTILLSPLYYIFGKNTLLIVQIFSILYGGIFILKYCKEQFKGKKILPYIILIQFLSIWGVISALGFDFHASVVGAMMVPPLFYHIEQRNFGKSIVYLCLILMCKEIMALWMLFLLIGLILKNWKKNKKTVLKFEFPMILISAVYGLVVILLIMPSLQGQSENFHLTRYAHLGSSFSDIIWNLLSQPKLLIDNLFTNTTEFAAYDNIKLESYVMFLIAGGIFCILRPAYLIMIIPIFAQKFLSNNIGFWGINCHYSIEFVPIIILASIDFLKRLPKVPAFIIGVIFMGSTITSTLVTLDSRNSKWYDPIYTKFYDMNRYKTSVDLKEIHKVLNSIDKDLVITSSSSIAPHLSMREKLYHYPIIKDSDMIVLFKQFDYYPYNQQQHEEKILELKNSEVYEVFYEETNLIVYKKKSLDPIFIDKFRTNIDT